MDKVSIILEWLRMMKVLTPLGKDILDTDVKLHKNPFDMKAAQEQIEKNNTTYTDVPSKIEALPNTVKKNACDITENDVKYILECQLGFLIEKLLNDRNVSSF